LQCCLPHWHQFRDTRCSPNAGNGVSSATGKNITGNALPPVTVIAAPSLFQ
jgi:hypothetical protein